MNRQRILTPGAYDLRQVENLGQLLEIFKTACHVNQQTETASFALKPRQHLLDLPAEILNAIYDLVLPYSAEIRIRKEYAGCPITVVCKKFRRECLPLYLQRKNKFRIDHPSDISCWISKIGIDMLSAWPPNLIINWWPYKDHLPLGYERPKERQTYIGLFMKGSTNPIPSEVTISLHPPYEISLGNVRVAKNSDTRFGITLRTAEDLLYLSATTEGEWATLVQFFAQTSLAKLFGRPTKTKRLTTRGWVTWSIDWKGGSQSLC